MLHLLFLVWLPLQSPPGELVPLKCFLDTHISVVGGPATGKMLKDIWDKCKGDYQMPGADRDTKHSTDDSVEWMKTYQVLKSMVGGRHAATDVYREGFVVRVTSEQGKKGNRFTTMRVYVKVARNRHGGGGDPHTYLDELHNRAAVGLFRWLFVGQGIDLGSVYDVPVIVPEAGLLTKVEEMNLGRKAIDQS